MPITDDKPTETIEQKEDKVVLSDRQKEILKQESHTWKLMLPMMSKKELLPQRLMDILKIKK